MPQCTHVFGGGKKNWRSRRKSTHRYKNYPIIKMIILNNYIQLIVDTFLLNWISSFFCKPRFSTTQPLKSGDHPGRQPRKGSIPNLPQAVCLLFGFTYALHLHYPKCLKNTFTFIQVMLSLGQSELPHFGSGSEMSLQCKTHLYLWHSSPCLCLDCCTITLHWLEEIKCNARGGLWTKFLVNILDFFREKSNEYHRKCRWDGREFEGGKVYLYSALNS